MEKSKLVNLTDENVEDDEEGKSGRGWFREEAEHVRHDDAAQAVEKHDQTNGT